MLGLGYGVFQIHKINAMKDQECWCPGLDGGCDVAQSDDVMTGKIRGRISGACRRVIGVAAFLGSAVILSGCDRCSSDAASTNANSEAIAQLSADDSLAGEAGMEPPQETDDQVVSRLIEKVISRSIFMKDAVHEITGMGDWAVKKLIDALRENPTESISVLTLLPVEKNTPAGIELARILGPSVAALRAGTATADDYVKFKAVCQNSYSTAESCLVALGLNRSEVDKVVLRAFDYESDISAALGRKYGLKDFCFTEVSSTYTVLPGCAGENGQVYQPQVVGNNFYWIKQKPKCDSGGSSVYHSPAEITLTPVNSCSYNEKGLTGIFIVYDYKNESTSHGVGTRARFSEGSTADLRRNNARTVNFKHPGVDYVYIPGKKRHDVILNAEVFGKDSSLEFRKILLVYPKVSIEEHQRYLAWCKNVEMLSDLHCENGQAYAKEKQNIHINPDGSGATSGPPSYPVQVTPAPPGVMGGGF